MKIVLAGAVTSSRRSLEGLLRNGANVVGVLGLSPQHAANVSGYCRLDDVAAAANVPYRNFSRINDASVEEVVRGWAPDLLFVVGLSQLVHDRLLAIPRRGCVGFHPTRLPECRGRAPIAWLTLENRGGAASFFLMDAGADSGPIFVQEPFDVSPCDYAADVLAKAETAIDAALNRWIPRLIAGEWNPRPQAEELATYRARRAPEDGLIDWSAPAEQVFALIRASSHPHPGAYTFFRGKKTIVWRAESCDGARIRGVVGRVLDVQPGERFLVQTGTQPIWLTEVADESTGEAVPLRVGIRLGVDLTRDIVALEAKVAELTERLAKVEKQPD